MNKKTAFSLIEISIVILIIGILITGVTKGSTLVRKYNISTARSLTQSAPVLSTSDLALWLDSISLKSFAIETSTIVTVDEPENGQAVRSWNNINIQKATDSTTAASQSSSSLQPLYINNSINGLPGLNFDGVDDYLGISDLSMFRGASSYTAFFVGNTASVFIANYVYSIFRAEPGIAFGFAANASASQAYCGRWVSASGLWKGTWFPSSASALTIKTPVICSIRYDGSNMQAWINGVSPDIATAASGEINIPNYVTIGAVSSGPSSVSQFFNGSMGEIIIFNRALKNEEMDYIEEYLGKKWKIKAY